MTQALIALAALLLLAMVFRSRVALLRWLHLPTSVIAGFLGLGVIQVWKQLVALSQPVHPDPIDIVSHTFSQWTQQWSTWPGWLIAIVFAAMLLGKTTTKRTPTLGHVRREGVMVWIIVLGQTAVGALLVWAYRTLGGEAHPSLGMLIETGFAGGHGTATAMGQVYASPQINLTTGRDLGTMMATIGLVYGIVSGVAWANLGIRRGWVQTRFVHEPNESDPSIDIDTENSENHFGHKTDLEMVLINSIWLAFAMGIGLACSGLVSGTIGQAEQWFDSSPIARASSQQESTPKTGIKIQQAPSPDASPMLAKKLRLSEIFASFPLFIYTLLGGFLVRQGVVFFGVEKWINAKMVASLSAVAMDILVVAAIASMNIEVIRGHAALLSLLVVGAAVWTGVCLLVLSKRILPSTHWFELGLINYGMSTGTTATGFVLLRMVDPKIRSGAAQDYALAAPLSSPFIGGGILTIGIPLFLMSQMPLALVAVGLVIAVAIMIFFGIKTQTS